METRGRRWDHEDATGADGTHDSPVSLEDPLSRIKPGSVAREVYWQFSKPLSRNSKNAMVGMRLSFPFCPGAANAF